MTVGSTTRNGGEFEFKKITLSLERDLVPAENPIDAYRDIKALLERMVTELQASKPPQTATAVAKSSPNTSAMKPKESVTPFAATPRPAASKLATLQERLGPRLQDLEVTDGMDGLIVKPRSYLGDSWAEVNEVVRSLGGQWISNGKQGYWRIPK
jgi:hypothetical protein